MYDFVAEFYKVLMPDTLYPMWLRFARPIIQKSGAVRALKKRGERPLCVDAGCGTGELAGLLAKHYDVIGIDISPEMLSEAMQSYQGSGIIWVRQDISRMNIGKRRAAAVFAATDVINHIMIQNKMSAFMKRAYDSLEEGGYMFFDVITEKMADYYALKQCSFEDFEWGSFFWTCKHSPKTNKLIYDISCFEKCEDSYDGHGEIYIRKDERIEERIWSYEDIMVSLKEAGFVNIHILDSISAPGGISLENYSEKLPEHIGKRIYFVCEKR